MPLLADQEESRLVTAGIAPQEREPDQDRDQCNHEDRVPFDGAC